MANVFETLETRKDKVAQVAQNAGMSSRQLFEVVLALDYSFSMNHLYTDGTCQEVVEKILPIGMAMDDNQSMEFYTFDNGVQQRPDITLSNITNYVKKNVTGNMGGTNYAPALRAIAESKGLRITPYETVGSNLVGAAIGGIKGLFGGKKAALTAPEFADKTRKYAVYIVFITDGQCGDPEATMEIIRTLSYQGCFVQFIGIGDEPLDFLQRLDNLSGRYVDNANFFRIPQIRYESDDSLYKKLFNEFPKWVELAKDKKLIE